MRPLWRDGLQRWGETRTGLQRLRCTGCRRTFSSATGTALARLRRPEQVQLVLADMLSRTPSSGRALAARLGVDKMTVWRWRKRILSALIGVGATCCTASSRPTGSSAANHAKAHGNGSITNGTRRGSSGPTARAGAITCGSACRGPPACRNAMCGWPPARKGDVERLVQRVACGHVSGLVRGRHGPQAPMGSADRDLNKSSGSRPSTSPGFPRSVGATDHAIALLPSQASAWRSAA